MRNYLHFNSVRCHALCDVTGAIAPCSLWGTERGRGGGGGGAVAPDRVRGDAGSALEPRGAAAGVKGGWRYDEGA